MGPGVGLWGPGSGGSRADAQHTTMDIFRSPSMAIPRQVGHEDYRDRDIQERQEDLATSLYIKM